jgi:peptidoglycan/LPS O-acetylase OafA/YrhL
VAFNIEISRMHISIIDGFAIVFIILSHMNVDISRIAGNNKLGDQFALFGLILFTFSAGFKFVFNHNNRLIDNTFLKEYLRIRSIRLYKPYIGYSLMIIPFLYIAFLLQSRISYLQSFRGLDFFNNGLIDIIYNFLTGHNPIAPHTWYLFTLFAVTITCFTLLYLVNNLTPKYRSFYSISALISLYLVSLLMDNLPFLPRSFSFLLRTYIIGLLVAYLYSNQRYLFPKAAYTMAILFPLTYMFFPNRLLYEWSFPMFIIIACNICVYIKVLSNAISYIGKNSFHIYLLHEPIIEPLLIVVFFMVLHINSITIIPIIVSTTILTSIILCVVLKKIKFNKIFEN